MTILRLFGKILGLGALARNLRFGRDLYFGWLLWPCALAETWYFGRDMCFGLILELCALAGNLEKLHRRAGQ